MPPSLGLTLGGRRSHGLQAVQDLPLEFLASDAAVVAKILAVGGLADGLGPGLAAGQVLQARQRATTRTISAG